ncbi:DUF6300 family protein [Rhodococcus sp. 4CII]|uniref:DUF6300 family protein n=2 Tax=unclassified Rhodococcus (in: high G+C Gram-positive bacteria) TaxID=192944 RepID=UPI001BB37646|nr:DUF6300 family protein [Rhodococcus sp. 4CII]
MAQFPSTIVNGRDAKVHGYKEAVLCATCDQDSPAAAELLALFTENDGTSPGNMQVFGELAVAWVE